MNLGSNATIETLKAIDHRIKYATDNIYELSKLGRVGVAE